MKDRRSPASRCSESGARAETKHSAVAWNAVWIAPPGWFMRFPLQTVAWYVALARQAKRPDMRYRSRNKRLERSVDPSQARMFCARLSTTPTSHAGCAARHRFAVPQALGRSPDQRRQIRHRRMAEVSRQGGRLFGIGFCAFFDRKSTRL